MDKFEAILFDFDGVLLDSEPIHCDCWREALAPLGVPVTWEAYSTHCVGASDRSMMGIFASLCDPPADPAKLWETYSLKKQLFQQRMAVDPPFAPGLAEFFSELHKTYVLAVVSSSASSEIKPLLDSVGISPHLSTVVAGGDVERHKPAPDPYLLAAKRLGIRHALAVEDSPAGMQSAQAAGFEVLRITDPSKMMECVRERLNGAS